MKKLLLFAFALVAVTACVNDFTEEIEAVAPKTMTISVEADETRIQLMEGKTVWNMDDLVSVFDKTNGNEIWRCYNETGSRSAELVCKYDNNGGKTIDDVIVYYPHESENSLDESGKNVITNFSDIQYYLEGSYGLKSSPMVAATEDGVECTLKYVCGWLKFQFVGNGEQIGRVVVKGNNGENLAGRISVNAAEATVVLDQTTASKSVTVRCAEFVELQPSTVTDFYVALLPTTFEKGITIEVYDAAGQMMSKSTNRTITIERNVIQPMETISVDCNVEVVKSITVAQKSASFNDIQVEVKTEGYPGYVIGVLTNDSTGALSDDAAVKTITENLKNSFDNWNAGFGMFGKEVTDASFSGNLLNFGDSYYPTLYPGKTYLLYILPLEDGKSRGEDGETGTYLFEDVKTWVFETTDIVAGGNETLTMEAIAVGYKNVEVDVTGGDNVAMIYAMSLPESDYKNLWTEPKRLEKLFATCKETPDPLIQSGNRSSVVLSGYDPGTTGYVMAVAVDKNGKYSALQTKAFTTKSIEYGTTLSVSIDSANSVAEWTTANMKINVAGGTAVSYTYLSMPMTTLNAYKYTDAQLEELMVLGNNYNVKNISASDLVNGCVQVTALTLNKEYKFGIMAWDASGMPSHATFTTVTPTVPHYSLVLSTDARWEATKPALDYTVAWDSTYNCFTVEMSVTPAAGTAKYWMGCYKLSGEYSAANAFETMILGEGPYDNSKTHVCTEAASRVVGKIYGIDYPMWVTWQDNEGNYYEPLQKPLFTQPLRDQKNSNWRFTTPTVNATLENNVLSYTVKPGLMKALTYYIKAYPSRRYVSNTQMEAYALTLMDDVVKIGAQEYSGTLTEVPEEATIVVAWEDKDGYLYESLVTKVGWE